MSEIKILVGYHKPSKLYKSDIFVPIHLGRAVASQMSKDGQLNSKDYQWLLENMIGDDTGDNISQLNRQFSELTGIYWAWKNYDKIGNPEYIGFMHYRRHLSREALASYKEYEIIACEESYPYTLKEQFISVHGENPYIHFCETLSSDERTLFESYMNQKEGYFYNIFIMKKDVFFEYCSFLFDKLFKYHEKTNYSEMSYYNQRMPGFMAERLTGQFITQFNHTVKSFPVEFKEEEAKRSISPQYQNEKSICICFACDDKYAPYLTVALQSIKRNNLSGTNYDICILDGGISSVNKRKIEFLKESNFSVRFVDMKPFLSDYDETLFSLNAHFTISTYFRFFIPQIFSDYERILYLDCDIVIHHDLNDLFFTDMQSKSIGAVLDTEMQRALFINEGNMATYLENTLQMKNPSKYFQAGVLLLDIKKLQQVNFTKKCLERLQQIQTPKYVDQCVLNSLFDGDIFFLDQKWNVEWHIPYYVPVLDRQLKPQLYLDYMEARNNPFIIHFSGAIKPWNDCSVELSEYWWLYARETPFYEMILTQYTQKEHQPFMVKASICEMRNYVKKLLSYYRYKILSKITFGKIRKHYKQKRKKVKTYLKDMKQ